MTALLASLLVGTIVFVPLVLLRIAFSLFFVPLGKLQRTKTDQVTLALAIALVPLFFSLQITDKLHHGMVLRSLDAAIVVFQASAAVDAAEHTDIARHIGQVEPLIFGYVRLYLWFLVLVLAEIGVLIYWCVNYWRLVQALELPVVRATAAPYQHLRNLAYRAKELGCQSLISLADAVLMPRLVEWPVILQGKLLYPKWAVPIVWLDILLDGNQLYSGRLEDFFLNENDELSGLLIAEVRRYKRDDLLQERQTNPTVDKSTLWSSIPSHNFYTPAKRIVNLNVRLEPNERYVHWQAQRVARQLGLNLVSFSSVADPIEPSPLPSQNTSR